MARDLFALGGGRAPEHRHWGVHVRGDRFGAGDFRCYVRCVECDPVRCDHQPCCQYGCQRRRDVARQQRLLLEYFHRHARLGSLIHEFEQRLLDRNRISVDVLPTPDGRLRAGRCGVNSDLRNYAADVESYHYRSGEALEDTDRAEPEFCGEEFRAERDGQVSTPSAGEKTHTRGEGDFHGLCTLRSESRAKSRALGGGLPLFQSQSLLESGLSKYPFAEPSHGDDHRALRSRGIGPISTAATPIVG